MTRGAHCIYQMHRSCESPKHQTNIDFTRTGYPPEISSHHSKLSILLKISKTVIITSKHSSSPSFPASISALTACIKAAIISLEDGPAADPFPVAIHLLVARSGILEPNGQPVKSFNKSSHRENTASRSSYPSRTRALSRTDAAYAAQTSAIVRVTGNSID